MSHSPQFFVDFIKKNRGAVALVAISAAIGVYAGFYALVPFLGAIIAGVALQRLRKRDISALGIAAAIQVGLLAWIAVQVMIWPLFIMLSLFDIVTLIVCASWLILRPGLAPAIILAIYHALAVLTNVNALGREDFGSSDHKVYVVHVFLRLLTIGLLIVGYIQMRKTVEAPQPLVQ